MKVGLTYDLKDDYLKQGFSKEDVAEFDRPEVIDGIEGALVKMGFEVDRIGHVKALTARLAAGDRWDFVFNIAEGMYGLAREAQVPALLEAYNIPFVFSSAWTMVVTLDKALTKTVLRHEGIATSDWHLIKNADDIKNISVPCPLFAKPVGEGSSKGITDYSVIRTPADIITTCSKMLKIYNQPVLIEPFLQGREVTVAVIGNGNDAEVHALMECLPKHEAAEAMVYGIDQKNDYLERVQYRVPAAGDAFAEKAKKLAVETFRALDCRDSARVDIRADKDGNPFVLEVNPMAGLHPIDSDIVIMSRLIGIDYQTLMGKIVRAFMKRAFPDHKITQELYRAAA